MRAALERLVLLVDISLRVLVEVGLEHDAKSEASALLQGSESSARNINQHTEVGRSEVVGQAEATCHQLRAGSQLTP